MKKKELLEMPKLTLTAGMIKQAKSNNDYSRFYRAVVKDGILKVAVWDRKQVDKKQPVPNYEIYVDKENNTWENYNVTTDSWGKARIENLNLNSHYHGDYYGVKGYETLPDKKLVNKYFDGEASKNRTIRDAVLKFQKKIASEKLQRAHSVELAEIDAVMFQVPDEPKDFEDWIIKDAFCHSQYMLYDKPAGKARCTNCWGVVPTQPKFRHNETGKCPLCHSNVTYKSWNKQKVIKDRKVVGIIQRMKDDTGYILRQWKVAIQYRKELDYTKELFRYEYLRYEMSDQFVIGNRYEWGEYKYTKKDRWCNYINHGMSGYYTDLQLRPECILYPRNITKLLKNTELKYMPVTKILRRKRGRYIEVDRVFHKCMRFPQFEMLLKVGLVTATYDMIKNSKYPKEWNKESPWRYLNISKEYYRMAVKHDMSIKEIKVMRLATEKNLSMSKEQINFFARYIRTNEVDTILNLGHTEKMYKYLHEISQRTSYGHELSDYMDYLNDLDYLHIPKSKAALFPKDFQTVHRELSELRLEKENRIQAMEIREKNKEFKKLLPEIKKLYEHEDDQFCIVIPECKKDFQLEGQLQHNCVGGTYFDKMLKEQCVVVFLRQKEDRDRPYCTVEFDIYGNVIQNRAIYNRQAPPEAVDFINKVSKKVKLEMKKAEAEKIVLEEKVLLPVAAG